VWRPTFIRAKDYLFQWERTLATATGQLLEYPWAIMRRKQAVKPVIIEEGEEDEETTSSSED